MPRCETTLPDQITAGLDFQAVVQAREYPATSWALRAILRGPAPIDLTATAQGEQFLFTAPAATTLTWTIGTYWYQLRATMGSAVMEAGSGQLCIVQDLEQITGAYDGRSKSAIALEAIDAVIARRATQDQQKYKINERELWRTPIADLLKLQAYYASKVARENAKASGRSRFGRPVIVKFSQQ